MEISIKRYHLEYHQTEFITHNSHPHQDALKSLKVYKGRALIVSQINTKPKFNHKLAMGLHLHYFLSKLKAKIRRSLLRL